MRKVICLVLCACFIFSLGVVGAAPDRYSLKPGDVLSVSVWGYEELQVNGVVIREDGRISFPIVGELEAEGLSTEELSKSITNSLQHFITDPRVTVNISKIHTTRIYVLGEVVRPGLYELEKQHNILDAISAAGGYTKDASKKKVYVISKASIDKPREINFLNLLRKGDMSQNLTLEDGDAVYLAPSGRVDFSRDVLPFITGVYFIKNFNDD